MKKKNIINLIKYHSEKNEAAFREEAYEIARYFDKNGEYQLGEYIMSLMSVANTFVPQSNIDNNFKYLDKIDVEKLGLPFPEAIEEDLMGVINAIGHNLGVNKFLFEGHPGTGKTESVKQIARILERNLYSVNFEELIDSRLGQSSKNIAELFKEIEEIFQPKKTIILFDEIDSIAMNRINSNDMREMGRATTTILKEMDKLNKDIVLIATTNLYNEFDKALIRRFDSIVNFDRYTQEDLLEISEIMIDELLKKFKNLNRNIRLFRKIMKLLKFIPYPGELRNLLKTSVVFSNLEEEFDYLRRLFKNIINISGKKNLEKNVKKMTEYGFTFREIEILTYISKSQVSRNLKKE